MGDYDFTKVVFAETRRRHAFLEIGDSTRTTPGLRQDPRQIGVRAARESRVVPWSTFEQLVPVGCHEDGAAAGTWIVRWSRPSFRKSFPNIPIAGIFFEGSWNKKMEKLTVRTTGPQGFGYFDLYGEGQRVDRYSGRSGKDQSRRYRSRTSAEQEFLTHGATYPILCRPVEQRENHADRTGDSRTHPRGVSGGYREACGTRVRVGHGRQGTVGGINRLGRMPSS